MVHPKQQLDGTTIKPKKAFGQNFLADESHLGAIARLVLQCAKDPARTVVEFGAGLGALTGALLAAGANVVAVERDRDLFPLLQKRFAGQTRLSLVEGNALTFSLDGQPAGFALCGNLPYHHAADLCMRCVDVVEEQGYGALGGGIFLIQLEVAERIAASPGTKDYGVLSVLLQSRFEVTLGHVVPKGAFWPVPEVDGGVIVLRPRPPVLVTPFASLQKVVKAAFGQRRKTVRNSLSVLADFDVDAALDSAGIDKGARAETIPVEGFLRLAAFLDEHDARGP